MARKKTIQTCCICGLDNYTNKKVYYSREFSCVLCYKHLRQMQKYGKIIDSSQLTTKDKNEIIIKPTHAEIVLRNVKQEIVGYALIDLEDIEKCKKYKWTLDNVNGYVKNRNPKIGKLHRYILNYHSTRVIDHINRNKLDNRKNNLRIVDVVTNQANNGAECIHFDRDKWRVKFARFGKRYYVGSYNTKEEAIIARDIKLKEIENNSESLLRKHKRKIQTKVKGVYPAGKRYWANFNADGKQHYVGTFDTIEEAIIEREKAIKKYKTVKQ